MLQEVRCRPTAGVALTARRAAAAGASDEHQPVRRARPGENGARRRLRGCTSEDCAARVTPWRSPAGRERQVPPAGGAQADFGRPQPGAAPTRRQDPRRLRP